MAKVISIDTKVQDIIEDIKNGESFIVVDKKGKYKGILTNERLIRYLFNPDVKVEKIYIKIKPLKTLNYVEICRKMVAANTRVLPVEINGKIELISIWDVLRNLSETDKNYFENTLARDVMNPPITVYENDDIKKVISIMKNRGISRVIVVDKDGKAVGILSISDIVRYFTFKKERATRGERGEIEEKLEVKGLLSGRLIYVKSDDNLYKIIKALDQNKIFAVPVLEREIPIGIITAKDILIHYLSYLDRKELPVVIHGIDINEVDKGLVEKRFKELYRKFGNIIGEYPRLILHIKKTGSTKEGLKRKNFYIVNAKLISERIKIFASESGYDLSSVIRSIFNTLEYEIEEKKEMRKERYYIERLLKDSLEYL